MSRLDENIGTMAYDGLIVAEHPVADVFSVTLRKGAAELARGTVLALSSRDDKFVILGTTAAEAVEAAPAVYGLTEDAALVAGKTYYTRSGDAGSYVYTPVASPEVANIATYYEITTPAVEAQDAEVLTANCILADAVKVTADADATTLAYRTGHFNRSKLTVKAEYTMTTNDEEDLRKGGILLSDAVEY
jgi:hypothetical protein